MAPKNDRINRALMKTVGYVRCSHQEQKLHGYTIEHQVKSLKKYAKEHGLVISEWYIDEARSSSKNPTLRKEFLRMMDDVKAGKVQFILFTKLDRYFRNIREFYRTEDILEQHGGVRWKATEEEFDNYTVKGKEMLHFKIVFAQMEADRISLRVKDVFGSMVEEKRPISGAQPLGYKIEGEGRNKKIVKDEATEHIVNDLFDYYETHRSKRGTVRYISEKYGFPVTYSRVSKLLKNEFYTGNYRGIVGYAPAYLTPERFENIQRIVKSNVKQTKGRRVFVFSGMVFCGHCGCRATGSTTTKANGLWYKHYRCGRYNNAGDCDNKKAMNETNIEKFLLENILDEVERYELRTVVEEAERPKTQNTAAKIKGKIKRIQQMYRDEMMEYEDFKAEYEELSEQLKQAEKIEKKHEKRDLTPIKKLLEAGFVEVYATMSDDEKRAFWGKIVREIKFYKDGKIEVFF